MNNCILDIEKIVGGGNLRTRESILDDLKKDNKPIAIFGTGKFAVCAALLLLKNNIKIKCFVDEEQYFYEGKIMQVNGNNFPCVLLKDFKDNPLTFNIVAGNINYDKFIDIKNLFKNCKYIEYLDGCNYHFLDKNFLEENNEILNKIYIDLKDKESKNIMKQSLLAKITGDIKGIIELKHLGGLYDWKLLKINKNDVFADGGAYVGDTIKNIKDTIGCLPKEIFAFEPDEKNIINLIKNFNPDELKIIHPICGGLYSDDRVLWFSSNGNMGSRISENGECSISTYALDNYQAFNNVSVIKMDIEGSEVEAIKGAKNLIKRNKPRLAICIYHKIYDIIDVYKLLKEYNPEYKFYLRHHSHSLEETVLYAI